MDNPNAERQQKRQKEYPPFSSTEVQQFKYPVKEVPHRKGIPYC
jgi:hypothetical protein